MFATWLVVGEEIVGAMDVAALTAKEEASEVEKAVEVAAGTVAVEASAKMQLGSGLLCTVTGPINKTPRSKHTQADWSETTD